MNGEEIILGIDPGSIRTGFGLVSCANGQLIHIAHGTILLDKKKPLAERLCDLAMDLATILNKYKPTIAAIEDVFVYKNPRSALILGQARGAALAVLGMHGLLITSFSPAQVKSLIFGHGRAKKFQVAHFVAISLNIELPKSPDAADALALAMAKAYYFSIRQN
jgi:crossover junction endodeoxyribonuclease RuvC